MTAARPNELRFIAFVHPDTRSELEHLGWALRGTAYASTPAIGVTFGRDVTFWEGDVVEPTFTLRSERIESARLAGVPDAIREHPGIELGIRAEGRRADFVRLDLRAVNHRSIDNDQRTAAFRQLEQSLNAE